nr:hypothetical protein [uncultured Pedobacter sp.]
MQDEKNDQKSDRELLDDLRNRSTRIKREHEETVKKINKLNEWVARIRNWIPDANKKPMLH